MNGRHQYTESLSKKSRLDQLSSSMEAISITSSASRGDSLTSIREGLSSVSKWKIALLLGAPLAFAGGLYYSRKKASKPTVCDDESKSDAPRDDSPAPSPKIASVKPLQSGMPGIARE